MTPEQYLGAVERIPLHVERETTDGRGYICRTRDNLPVQVTKPEHLTAEERQEAVDFLRALYGAPLH